jgi:hypothetical protein
MWGANQQGLGFYYDARKKLLATKLNAQSKLEVVF